MSKKQFYTNTSPNNFQPNNQNIKKHKFSNFTAYNQVSNSHQSPIGNSNLNINANTSTNNVMNSNIIRDPNSNKNFQGHTKSIEDQRKQKTKIQQTNQKYERSTNNAKINQLNKYNKNIDKQSNVKNSNQNIGNKNPYNTAISNPNTKKSESIDFGTKQSNKLIQKCAICGTQTQKCCSLCRKVFYCSAEHQQVDWHMRHKFQCEGRVTPDKNYQQHDRNNNTNNINPNFASNTTNKFIFYSNNPIQSNQVNNQQYQRQLDYQAIHKFLQLLQQRLVLRTKIMNQASKINERTQLIVRQSLVKQTEQLLQLSTRITNQQYKPSYSRKITKKDIMEYSSHQWGSQVVITQIGVGLEYYADLVLMAKMYHLCGMTKQARNSIIAIGRLLQQPEQKNIFLTVQNNDNNNNSNINKVSKKLSYVSNQSIDQKVGPLYNSTNTVLASSLKQQQLNTSNNQHLSHTKNLILSSIIQLSELYNIDKTSQSTYKIFVKKVQIQQGIWQQIYAYFNMGVWYMTKTYFDKSIKSFMYALQLLDSHKKGMVQSSIFKADCLFNIGLGFWALRDISAAIQNMQDCYRIRVNSIGKNSMQCSYCLYKLAQWYKQTAKWNQCLQYLDQCHRVRKLYQNQPNFEAQLQQIKLLITQVYQMIKKQKQRGRQKLDPKAQQYFSQLLQKQQQQQSRQHSRQTIQMSMLDQGTIASRLFKSDKQLVKFKVQISQQFWATLNSQQIKLLKDLVQLIQLSDKKMEKSQAIRILIQSPFVNILNSQQRQLFFKQNQVDKFKQK